MAAGARDTRSTVPVLYVDDDHANRTVFEHGFKERFSIITCASAMEALEVMAAQEIGVLVTDQRMPKMSGNELLVEAKQRWPSVVRIVITAYSDLDPILSAINEGLVARYVVKPWDRDELSALLDWACEIYIVGRRDEALKARLLQTERLALVGSFAAGALHDINNVLSVLLLNGEVLRRYGDAMPVVREMLMAQAHSLSARQHEQVASMIDNLPQVADDMSTSVRLTTGVVQQVSNLIQGGGDVEDRVADPVAIASHALSIAAHQLAVGVRASYVGPKPLPLVKIAPSGLFRVLLNLVTNAAQALKRTGARGRRIDIDALCDTDTVVLIVQDDGPGMSSKVLKMATKEFFTTRSDGTGLGLTQCQRLVKEAGGAMEIKSTEGEGTTVTISLIRLDVASEPPTRQRAG